MINNFQKKKKIKNTLKILKTWGNQTDMKFTLVSRDTFNFYLFSGKVRS